MSHSEYVIQLKEVNKALETSTGQERVELLSLKNSIEELLAIVSDNEEKNDNLKNIDNEYALFMAEIDTKAPSSSHKCTDNGNSYDISQLKSLEGKKCKAPHVTKLGDQGYHNAMICSILEGQNDSESGLQVKILFTNPTSYEMLPCPFYFENDCKFSAEKCKYSHGEVVLFSELKEYIKPSFETLEVGSDILAKQSENQLWKRARIKKIAKEKCTVKFEENKTEDEVMFKDILPLDDGDKESDSDSEDYDQNNMETINMSLMNTPSDGVLGGWEKFTTGIGSKLMCKMGYIVGTGLGKRSDGIIEPVTAVILPAGKSLDHCMNLREKCGGDKNLFNAEKKLRTLQRKQEIRNQKMYEKSQQQTDLFNFLNKSLVDKQDNSPDPSDSSQHRKTIKHETCRNLNVASLKTDENIRKTEKDLFVIRESLKRHKDANSQVYQSLIKKLGNAQEELRSLKKQAQNIKNEQNLRKDKKKLTTF